VKPFLIAVMACATIAAQSKPTFRSGADAVRVDVLVTDRNRPIAGLTTADFELRDNNVLQTIEAVVIEDVPVSLMLVLDTSTSVEGQPLADLKKAASAAVNALGPGDRVALLTFAQGIALRVDWTGDRGPVSKAIDTTSAGGSTSLYDAAYAGMTMRDLEPGRRSLVLLFTDGHDTASWLPSSAAIDRARRTEAVVYGVSVSRRTPLYSRLMFRSGIELSPSPRVDWASAPLLEELSDITGGQNFTAGFGSGLAEAFERVVKEFRSRYLLTYSPKGVAAGGWHTIDVRLKNRSGQVRARRGYTR
jgi:Ca-activated chloride channel family protein